MRKVSSLPNLITCIYIHSNQANPSLSPLFWCRSSNAACSQIESHIWLYLYLYIHIHICIYIYIYIFIYIHKKTYIYLNVYIYIYVYTCAYKYEPTYWPAGHSRICHHCAYAPHVLDCLWHHRWPLFVCRHQRRRLSYLVDCAAVSCSVLRCIGGHFSYVVMMNDLDYLIV